MYFFYYQELHHLNDILFKSSWANNKTSWKPLFHGTRLFSIKLSVQEKWKLHEVCFTILERITHQLQQVEPLHGIDWSGCHLAQLAYRNFGEKDFQYSDFYLTDNIQNAIGYSRMPFGEIGSMVKQMIYVAYKNNLKVRDELMEDIHYFEAKYIEFQESVPIVLVFQDVRFKDLKMETGEKMDKQMIAKINELNQGYIREDSFRLRAKDYKYKAFYFDEDLYDEAKDYFAFRE